MLDLSNLSTEIRILLIVVVGGILGAVNHKFNPNPTAQNVLYGVIVVVAIYMAYTLSVQESFENTPSPSENEVTLNETNMTSDEMPAMNMNMNMNDVNDENDVISLNNQNNSPNVSGSYGVDNDETYKEVNNNVDTNQLPNECYPKDILSPKELLPKDTESTWAQSVPAGQGSLGDQNFLNAGFHIGINTVGQTLRNPNYGLRSEPPNPQVKVSPWMQTTIEPDTNRRAMEIA